MGLERLVLHHAWWCGWPAGTTNNYLAIDMSRNGQLSLSPSAKAAAEKYRAKAFSKAMNICKFNNPQQDMQVAGLCRDSWIAGYFYAKQEENRSPSLQIQY